MLDRDLRAHAGEFRRLLRNHQWERTDDGGILFPSMRALVRGVYVHDVNGLDQREDANLVTIEGLNHMLDVELGAVAQIAAWYMGLYAGAVSPVNTWTGANWVGNATEITSGTEGYSESTRRAFTPAAAAAGVITNSAAKAAFTIVTASALVVNGCGIASASAKGATTGKLFSAARFASARSLSNADVFNLGYTLTTTST